LSGCNSQVTKPVLLKTHFTAVKFIILDICGMSQHQAEKVSVIFPTTAFSSKFWMTLQLKDKNPLD
jgi:hypothetical protein